MALAQLVVQVPGTLIKSGDWNNEFQNILIHPISLISPTTGAINFNLQAHTGLLPSVITATSANAGDVLQNSGGATVFAPATVSAAGLSGLSSGALLIGTSSGGATTIPIGSTGQVFAVTSSKSNPAWQVIPPDGGLSTTPPSGGMTYAMSSSNAFLKGIAIGSSGQVYMVGTNGFPAWQNLTTAGSAGGGGSFSTANDITLTEDFILCYSTVGAGGVVNGLAQIISTAANTSSAAGGAMQAGSGVYTGTLKSAGSQFLPFAIINLTSGSGALAMFSTVAGGQGGQVAYSGPTSNYASTTHYTYKLRFQANSTAAGTIITGFTTNPDVVSTSLTGIFFGYTATTNVALTGITSSGNSVSLGTGVTSTGWHTYQVDVTSSQLTLTVDGAVVGNITSSGIPNIPLTWIPAAAVAGTVVTSGGIQVDYYQLISTNTLRV